jgi:Domain of unknown function (DUF4382)
MSILEQKYCFFPIDRCPPIRHLVEREKADRRPALAIVLFIMDILRRRIMKRFLAGYIAFVLLSLIGGCQKEETLAPGDGSGRGTLAVRMTDAPAGYDAVNIAVDSVRVHVDSGDSTSGWYTISRSPAMYDLLQFMGGKDTLIAEGEIPAGYYSQMRLYIGGGSNVVVAGVTHPLETPSGSQSGLKLNIQATIIGGVKYVLVLDFDAGRSIVVTGNGRYLLKPVIKTVAIAVSGSLTGVVAPAATNSSVWAIAGTDTSSTIADTTGFFRFKYLLPATYSLTIVPADTTYRDTTLTNVIVVAGQNKDVGTIALLKK